MQQDKQNQEILDGDEEEFEDNEVFESSYTSDFEDDDPSGSFCDMPEDELEQYKQAKQDSKK